MIKDDAIKDMYRHDFCSFAKFAFHILHPHSEYQHNWHIELLADRLTQVMQGKIKRLIINMPPRMLKSHCASVAWVAWMLGRDPRKKILCLNASNVLGKDLQDSCLTLMKSKRYQAVFEQTLIEEKTRKLQTQYGGYRQYIPMEGKLTGIGADIVLIDDPISAQHAQNDSARAHVNEQFDQSVLQRLNHKKDGAIIVVMQRLHEDDLSGHLLKRGNDWVHLDLSAFAMKDEKWELSEGGVITRKKGEVLHPERESCEDLVNIMLKIGGYAFAMQYLQCQYKTRFGTIGHGCVWLTPKREGIFWDARKEDHFPIGFYHFTEEMLMLPKVFGKGEDPCPDNMRNALTMEELPIYAEVCAEISNKIIAENKRKYSPHRC